jgi:hypothetical protein
MKKVVGVVHSSYVFGNSENNFAFSFEDPLPNFLCKARVFLKKKKKPSSYLGIASWSF